MTTCCWTTRITYFQAWLFCSLFPSPPTILPGNPRTWKEPKSGEKKYI
jgi:hypothetical protein